MTDNLRVFTDDRLERFWNKVDKSSGVCWYWKGSKGQSGHGQSWDGKRLVNAHRVSYEIHIGKIPKGLTVDHICQNPPCVNPDHLQTITMADNCRLGSPAQNTHCPKGHPFEGRNTIWHADKKSRMSRMCRICKQDKDRKYHWRNRDRINAKKKEAWRKLSGKS